MKTYKEKVDRIICLGLDIGSSSAKCAAFSIEGEMLAESTVEYNKLLTNKADELFSYVCTVIRDCAGKIKDNGDIASITVSSFGESFAAVDRRGSALSDIVTYSESWGEGEVDLLLRKVPDIGRIAGANPKTFYALPKIMCLLKTRPEIKSDLWKFLQIMDFIIYRLSGETVIDYALACRALAFDVINRRWSDEILAAAGIGKDTLSDPVPAGTIAGEIRESLARSLGVPANTKIIAGAHDQVATAIGAGVLSAGEAVIGTGSVECITPVFDHPILEPGFLEKNYACIPHAVHGKYVTYAFSMTGGALLSWFRDTLAIHLNAAAQAQGRSVYDLLNESCPPQPSDLLVIPHFGGTGTPELNQKAAGTITGFTLDTGLPDIYRAVLEGLCFEMRYNREQIADFGVNFNSLRATGGGARSDIWLQMKADIIGVPVTPLATANSGLTGGAMLAAVSLGAYDSLEEAAKKFVKVRDTFYPSDGPKGYYNDKYRRYQTLRNAMLY